MILLSAVFPPMVFFDVVKAFNPISYFNLSVCCAPSLKINGSA